MMIPTETWTVHARKHAASVSRFTDAFLKRRQKGETHAVHDFLFTYYSFSPAKLKQWVPSINQALIVTPQTQKEYPWLNDYWFQTEGNVLSVNSDRIHKLIQETATFIATLCKNILDQPPRFGCFGLHEWAMVYKATPRHEAIPLRITRDKLNAFVASQKICCSHYDAFRFFTEEARPLNILNPLLETRLKMEQGGCIHANMDIYKWATKLWPWIGSDFIGKAFFLAMDGREIDMRASPYDLSEYGYLPIRIETEEGRKEYQSEQQRLTSEATILRQELLTLSQRILSPF